MNSDNSKSDSHLIKYYYDIAEDCWKVELAPFGEAFYLNGVIPEEFCDLAFAAFLIQNHIKEMENQNESRN